MTTVPVEELPDRLDELVKKSRGGEHILITEAGRGVAELTPVNDPRKAMAALRRAGTVSWSGGKPQGLRDVEVKGADVSETILEDRR